MLTPPPSHQQFQASLQRRLAPLLRALPSADPSSFAENLQLVWYANLDAFAPTLAALYDPAVGRPGFDPLAMFRSLLLMHQRGVLRITDWAEQLHTQPILAVLAGFEPDQPPAATTLYDFLARCHAWRRGPGSITLPPRKSPPAPKRGQKVPPNERKLARFGRFFLRLFRQQQPSAALPEDTWNELLNIGVVGSVQQGIIPTDQPVDLANDTADLRSGGNSFGHRNCSCPDRNCSCPRTYSDPGARTGWDSSANCFYRGRKLGAAIETASGHGLPLVITLHPADRSDPALFQQLLVRGRRALSTCQLGPGFALADSAADYPPLYDLAFECGFNPLFDRRAYAPEPLPDSLAAVLTAHGATLDANDRPRCARAFLHSAGHVRPGVHVWRCPLRDPQTCPVLSCPLRAGASLIINERTAPRRLTANPRKRLADKRRYNKRTDCERFNSLCKAWCRLDLVRHRRDYLYLGRSAVCAILTHIRLWRPKRLPPAQAWIQNWLAAC